MDASEYVNVDLVQLAHDLLGPDQAAAYLSFARPAVGLFHDDTAASHLGGDPVLAPEHSWPLWNGTPLNLVACLDLGELADLDAGIDLPHTGFLNFFYDAKRQHCWGHADEDRGAWRVLFVPEGGAARETPDGVHQYPTVGLRGRQILTTPGTEEDACATWRGDFHAELLELESCRFSEHDRRPLHQLGGWPNLVQERIAWHETEPHHDGEPWTLLAQFDSDPAAGFMWVDIGIIYFGIAEPDLRKRDFDHVNFRLQT